MSDIRRPIIVKYRVLVVKQTVSHGQWHPRRWSGYVRAHAVIPERLLVIHGELDAVQAFGDKS